MTAFGMQLEFELQKYFQELDQKATVADLPKALNDEISFIKLYHKKSWP